ncbi:MAG: hypothetical protein VX335_03990 [Pseudomonadota bacterium]|nr:hypothetical protein [Pseudomonadota bacterium]
MNSNENNSKGISYLTKITTSLLRLGRDSKDVGQKYAGNRTNPETQTKSNTVYSSAVDRKDASKTSFNEEATEANTFELLHNLFI